MSENSYTELGSIVVGAQAIAVYWECRPEMRWYTELVQKPPVLQQAWRSSLGEIEWRDVPTVFGQR